MINKTFIYISLQHVQPFLHCDIRFTMDIQNRSFVQTVVLCEVLYLQSIKKYSEGKINDGISAVLWTKM